MRAHPADGFDWIETPAGLALVCRALRPLARHIFTTRQWTLGFDNEPSDSSAGWGQVARALAVEPSRLARVRQVHGAEVSVVRRGAAPPRERAAADIIVTDDPSCAVAIQTADCVPLLVADRRTGAVCAAHAGWRGLAARVPSVAVSAMNASYGSRPDDLVIAVGPSIAASRYEVGRDVRDRFGAAGFSDDALVWWFPVATRPGHWLFDGWQSARDQLEAAGVPSASIHVAELCTAEHPDLFCSYRRDGSGTGRLAAAIRVGR